MSVKLVWATPNIEETIAYCARVSNPANQHNNETADKLLKYCVKHKHWSVFEQGEVCLEITTTRDIARQILRHRSYNFQEFSQRYMEVTEFAESTPPRMQDNKNRQNSIETNDEELTAWWIATQNRVKAEVEFLYREALRRNIAKEVARKLLPEGLTMSRMYMKGSVRSWMHYCEIRTGVETQLEHREVAQECYAVLQSLMPNIFGERE